MDTSILEDIGLTGAEIKVFLALLELGSSSAGKVVEKSGLQNAVVHRAFHSLAEKGLLTYVQEGRSRVYQAIDPKMLFAFLDEKKARLQKIIPELQAKQALAKEKPRARLFQGVKGVKELLNLVLDTNAKQYFAYGGALKSNETMGEFFWEHFHRKRVDRGILGKILFHNSLKYWADFLNTFKKTTVKTTDKEFEALTETVICGDRVGIIFWLDKPSGLLIEEPLAAQSYKKFFELLWKGA